MRIDRSHYPWLIFTLLATLVATLLYLAGFAPRLLPFHLPLPSFLGAFPPGRRSPGATPLGLIFGLLAFAIFLLASALGIRKKRRLWPLGDVRHWLKAHIWLTIFSIPLILFHCGFHVGGAHAQWLIFLYAVVMISGFAGLGLQQFMPALMKNRLPREFVFEEIPHLQQQLFARVLEIRNSLRPRRQLAVTDSSLFAGSVSDDQSTGELAQFLDTDCLPYLSARRGDRLRLANATRATQIFHTMRMSVAAEWHPQVDQIEQCCGERRWMDVQTRFQHWLHGWLLVHVPASFALLIFTTWHAWVAIRYLIVPL